MFRVIQPAILRVALARCCAVFTVAGLALLPSGALCQQDSWFQPEALDKALDTEIAALRAARPSVEFGSDPDGAETPPASVTAAGPEFVEAWREYQRFHPPTASAEQTSASTPVIRNGSMNVCSSGGPAYAEAMRRLTEGIRPPTPEELTGFYYADGGFCGNSGDPFYALQTKAIYLACIKHRQFQRAVAMEADMRQMHSLQPELAASGSSSAQPSLLEILGIDHGLLIW